MNNSESERTPPYKITTEQGDLLREGYESYGHAIASASKVAIDCQGHADLDGSPIAAVLVKDATDKVLRRVTKNYPAD